MVSKNFRKLNSQFLEYRVYNSFVQIVANMFDVHIYEIRTKDLATKSRDENFPPRNRICKSIYNARTMTSRCSDLRGGGDYDILPQLSGKYIHSRRSHYKFGVYARYVTRITPCSHEGWLEYFSFN